MATLHFGVVDFPYSSGKGKKKMAASSMTTLGVARILESNYGLFQTFYDLRKADIANAVARSYAGALNSMMNGAPPRNPGAGASEAIQTMFREMVTLKQFDGKIPGVPTQASKDGISHRLKRPRKGKVRKLKYNKKRGARPSFRDTGLFLSSVRIWVD